MLPTPRNTLIPSRLPVSSAANANPASSSAALAQAHAAISQAAQTHNALVTNLAQDPNAASSDEGQAALDASKARLVGAINMAAAQADTPQKWAATLGVLHANGIDPEGYEDFNRGRGAILAAQSGLAPQVGRPLPENLES